MLHYLVMTDDPLRIPRAARIHPPTETQFKVVRQPVHHVREVTAVARAREFLAAGLPVVSWRGPTAQTLTVVRRSPAAADLLPAESRGICCTRQGQESE